MQENGTPAKDPNSGAVILAAPPYINISTTNHAGWWFFYARKEAFMAEPHFTLRTICIIIKPTLVAAFIAYELWRWLC